MAHRKCARQHHALHSDEARHACGHRARRVHRQGAQQQPEVRDFPDDHRGQLHCRGTVQLRPLAVAGYQARDVADLKRHLHERERQEQIPVLVLVEPLLGLARVEAQERHGGVHVLVQRVVIAVDVVRHLVVVAPHETGTPDEVVRQAQRVVHPYLGRHGAMVPAVLDSKSDPRPREAKKRTGEQPRGIRVEAVRRDSCRHDGGGGAVAPHAVQRLALLRKQFAAHTLADAVVER
mmetsp:Transcript_27062/g.43320  ORF Transcript_27062/g.43320 Transcript_27062/m.43320 type:complete len:235 (-) Transcript_27062:592-1296(-)